MHTSSSVAAPSIGGRPRRPGKRVQARAKTLAKATKVVSGAATRISGDEIRAKIAANRAKRLAIAEAMKHEAGVTAHTIQKEEFGGLAYIGTGRIQSPEGRKITQLYIVAHECGHIFLHNTGAGYWFAGHIKELEAESYAHQAFREHGMVVPRRMTQWGRQYVGSWIARDRAAGIAIDPRAEAYASGHRSPYEPLRMVPSTWQTFPGDGPRPVRPAARVLGNRLMNEARAVGRLVGYCLLWGYMAMQFALTPMMLKLYPDVIPPDFFQADPGPYPNHRPERLAAVGGALLLANLAVMWRTLRGASRPQATEPPPRLRRTSPYDMAVAMACREGLRAWRNR
jgi:hypothetical protein